jgi:membrane-associated phospholipid phosphatase
MTGNICEFEKISLADDNHDKAELKFVNPFASLAELSMNFKASQFELEECPNLASKNFATEMVELYCQVLVRDLPFNDYKTIDSEILEIMNDNAPYLKYLNNTEITSKNIFKGIFAGELQGPFISQLLYHDIINGASKIKQQYRVLCDTNDLAVNNRNEWGVTLEEAIDMQNCFKSKVLAGRAIQYYSDYKYIYNGRSLAEVVHNDPAYIFYFNASSILSSMKVKPNPTFMQYQNQAPFITGSGGPNIQCAIAEVTNLALKVAWYYKWQKFRRLRPEAAGIGIHNVMNNIVPNTEYNLNNWLFNNNELLFNKIKDHNENISGEKNQYLLSQVYPEGCPVHPAYPSGHSVIAGACATILKIFYDGDEKWNRPNYLVSQSLSGPDLTPYTGSDLNDITVGGEIDKLASNVGAGRMWAGVHYRSDNVAALLLGEQIAIEFFKKCLALSYEANNSKNKICISFKNFKGVTVHIQPAQ